MKRSCWDPYAQKRRTCSLRTSADQRPACRIDAHALRSCFQVALNVTHQCAHDRRTALYMRCNVSTDAGCAARWKTRRIGRLRAKA